MTVIKHSSANIVGLFKNAVTLCIAMLYIAGCTSDKPTAPAPVPVTAKIVHFSKDTLNWNISFADTLHVRDLSAAVSNGGKLTTHFVDSRQGMSMNDSIFSWTPKDTGAVFINATICSAKGGCDTLRDTLHVRFAATRLRPFRLSRDTVTRFVKFVDTLRPDSAFKARFGDASFTLRLLDSVAHLSLHDSVLSWLALDTIPVRFRIAQCITNGPCDTLAATLGAVNGPLPRAAYRFSTDSACLNWVLSDTIRASRLTTGRLSALTLIEGPAGMSVKDSALFWIPRDVGAIPIAIAGQDSLGNYYMIRDTFFVHTCSPDLLCPPYTHKTDATIGRAQDLPGGFFVYTNTYTLPNVPGMVPRPGIWISDINKYSPSIIPGTETDYAYALKISDDGKWILYINNQKACLIQTNGSAKVEVPLPGVSVTTANFYRNGPYGAEICYTTTDTVRCEMFAIQVTLDSVATFGTIRTLFDVTGSYRLEPYYAFSVVKDQILGAFSLRIPSGYALRMGFLTIPGGGRQIAGPKDIYAWKNETGKQYWGCNAAMSFDGSQCLYIPGIAGDASVYQPCIPQEHRGFVVTPFRRAGDSAITMDDHIDKYALSINWCPSKYNFGVWDQMDFHGWYFGNNNDLAIGCLAGSSAPYKGIWMVDWKRNIWTQLTPADSAVNADQPAVYFTSTDTGNPLDPQYRVIAPNGGESFTVGKPCTVSVSSRRFANAAVRLKIQNGKYSFLLPGMTSSINPRVDSVFIFTMPDSFTMKQPNPQTGTLEDVKISSISDSCRICVQDYTASTGFSDCSDGVFKITAGH